MRFGLRENTGGREQTQKKDLSHPTIKGEKAGVVQRGPEIAGGYSSSRAAVEGSRCASFKVPSAGSGDWLGMTVSSRRQPRENRRECDFKYGAESRTTFA